MTLWLPLVSLLLAVLSRVAIRDREQPPRPPEPARSLALLAIAIVAALLAARFGPELDRTGLVAGVLGGCLSVWLGAFLGGPVAPLAIGVAAASALHGLPQTNLPAAQLALVAGAGVGALVLGGECSPRVSVFASICLAGDLLGAAHSKEAGAAFLGSEVGLAVVLGALLVAWEPKRLPPLRPVVVAIFALAAAFFAAKPLGEQGLILAAGIGALTGVVLHWMLADDESDSLRIGIAAIIGIGLATIAFGLGKGAGMALSLVSAAGVLLAVGNTRAVLTLGPLVGLVLYRVLREQGTGATRALDIGQHYTLLTLLLGAVLPLLPIDWAKRDVRRPSVGAFLWGMLALGIAPLTIVMFGMRGAIGFVVGLGMAGLVQSIRKDKDGLPLALGTGVSGATVLCAGWLAKADEMAREDKVRLLAYSAVGILIVAGALLLLCRPSKSEVTA